MQETEENFMKTYLSDKNIQHSITIGYEKEEHLRNKENILEIKIKMKYRSVGI